MEQVRELVEKLPEDNINILTILIQHLNRCSYRPVSILWCLYLYTVTVHAKLAPNSAVVVLM